MRTGLRPVDPCILDGVVSKHKKVTQARFTFSEPQPWGEAGRRFSTLGLCALEKFKLSI